MTWSARNNRDGAMVRPRAFADLRLVTGFGCRCLELSCPTLHERATVSILRHGHRTHQLLDESGDARAPRVCEGLGSAADGGIHRERDSTLHRVAVACRAGLSFP